MSVNGATDAGRTAVTNGGKNTRPDSASGKFRRVAWVEDEIILALDLYLRGGPLDDADSQVIELSELLRALPIHPVEIRRHPKFRNPNGVHLKLTNFLALDPSYAGAGMGRYSRLDAEVFTRFQDQPDRVRELAGAIRAGSERFPVAAEEGEEEAHEGRLLMRQHLHRERNRRLRNQKIQYALKDYGRLPCEVCGIEFGEMYGAVGQGFIEIHHRMPLHLSGPRATKLDDLALLCPNCHRVLHRDASLTIEELATQVKRSRSSGDSSGTSWS